MNSVVKVIQPAGILDAVTANQLRREITEVVEQGADVVLLDFQEVTFMNSTALGTLVSTLRITHSSGSQLFICSLSEQVKMIFELTKMNRIFKIFADRDEFDRKALVV